MNHARFWTFRCEPVAARRPAEFRDLEHELGHAAAAAAGIAVIRTYILVAAVADDFNGQFLPLNVYPERSTPSRNHSVQTFLVVVFFLFPFLANPHFNLLRRPIVAFVETSLIGG